ncbi:disulfide bond formation protein B [Devosia marina]|uniref:Disulfide bond formation protein B n=1 Tax=Devosia marina TaxID=2683198 RepID=A0A7X3K425_9HYPH|nr:disulfide bond formation protein B [Devosia marina]MVS99488.1 disulfide bond formation protein B [Devosia marina]
MTSSRPLDKFAAGLAFVLGLVTILAALGSQFIGGLQPCELCLEQRLPYYWGLPLLALVLILWNRLPLTVWYVAMAIVAALFAWGAYLGGFHSGVEWGFWPGPTACAGVGTDLSMDMLNDLQPVIGCDVVQFRFLGISLAGYNALISAAVVGLLLMAMAFQFRRRRN